MEQELIQQRPAVWSSGLFNCCKDEESCWWGTWCCWLLSARNSERFEVGSSFAQSCTFVGFIVIVLLSLIVLPQASLLLLIGGLVYYCIYRGQIRTKIREKYGIQGSLCEDVAIHSVCACCAVCQEAQEANVRNTRHIDFCCGQELDTIHDVPVEGVICDEVLLAEDGNFLHHVKYLSKTSQLVLIVFVTVVFLVIPAMLHQSMLTVMVLFLTFLQPVAILWYFYWRKNRKHALLDYVIKMFLYGFCISTSLSMLFEQMLSVVCLVALQIILLVLNIHISLNDVAGGGGGDGGGGDATTAGASDVSATQVLNYVYKQFNQYHDASFSYFSGDSGSANMSPFGVDTTDSSGGTSDTFDPSVARKYLLLAVVAMFVMAFVIAAGVEESMKHMAVRCTRFPSLVNLKNPRTSMVYLMAAAAGFACAENIEYVFSSAESPIGGSPVVGELFILAMRWCMPVHIICSVLQASQMSMVSWLVLCYCHDYFRCN